jgi:hypothetical protein
MTTGSLKNESISLLQINPLQADEICLKWCARVRRRYSHIKSLTVNTNQYETNPTIQIISLFQDGIGSARTSVRFASTFTLKHVKLGLFHRMREDFRTVPSHEIDCFQTGIGW